MYVFDIILDMQIKDIEKLKDWLLKKLEPL